MTEVFRRRTAQARARKKMADAELKHAQELIMMLSEGGHEQLLQMRGEANARPMNKSERIIDVVTWSYRKESPFRCAPPTPCEFRQLSWCILFYIMARSGRGQRTQIVVQRAGGAQWE